MMSYFIKKNKEYIFLLVIFLIISLAIILKSYFNFNGYISPDSGYYLALAKHLLNGEGFVISAYEYGGTKNAFFATWPVGYPVLIMLVSKFTGLSIFWSSKVLNIVLLGFLFLFLKLLFKKKAYIYSFVFLFSSYLEILSFTWSENLFLLSMICFSYFLNNVIFLKKNLYIQSTFLLLSTLLLFLSRYIGAFSICVLILVLIYLIFFKKEPRKIYAISFTCFFNLIFVIGYLYNNLLQTGFIQGSKYNAPNPNELHFDFFISLIKALTAEFLIPVHTIHSLESKYLSIIFLLLQFFAIFYIYFNHKDKIKKFIKKKKIPSIGLIFMSVGLFYICILIFLKFVLQNIDSFGYRLLAPGTLLIIFAVISYILQSNSPSIKKKFLICFLPFIFISLLLNFPVKIFFHNLKNPLTYQNYQNNILYEYINAEKDSIVIFSERRHIRYLRNDLERLNPNKNENWENFINRIDPEKTKNIYLKTPTITDLKDIKIYDQSIFNKIVEYPPNKLIKIR